MQRKETKSQQTIRIEDALFSAQNLLTYVASYPLGQKSDSKANQVLRMLKRIFNVQVYKSQEEKAQVMVLLQECMERLPAKINPT